MDHSDALRLSDALQTDLNLILKQVAEQQPQQEVPQRAGGWFPAPPVIGEPWVNLGTASVGCADRMIFVVFSWVPLPEQRFVITWDVADTPFLDPITFYGCLEDFDLAVSGHDWIERTVPLTSSLRYLPLASKHLGPLPSGGDIVDDSGTAVDPA